MSQPTTRASETPASSHPNPLQRLSVQVGTAPLLMLGLALAAVFVYLFTAIGEYQNRQNAFWALHHAQVLNQRYVKEVLLGAQGYRSQTDKTAAEIRQVLDALVRGGSVAEEEGTPPLSIPAITSPSLRKQVLDAQTHADLLLVEGTQFSQSLKVEDSKSRLFEDLYRKSLDLQSAADHLVDTLDRHLESSASWWQVDTVAVELAERQRMAIQQYVKEILFVAHGIPADYQSSRNKIQDTLRILKSGGYIKVEPGQSIRIPAQTSADLLEALRYFDDSFVAFSAASNQFLMMSNASVERTLQLKKLSDASLWVHQDLSRLKSGFRSHHESHLHSALRHSLLSLVIIFLLAAGGLFLWIESRVSRPLRTVSDLLLTPSITPAQRGRFLAPLSLLSSEISALSRGAASRAAVEEECAAILGIAESHIRSQKEIPVISRSSEFSRFPIIAAAHGVLDSLRKAIWPSGSPETPGGTANADAGFAADDLAQITKHSRGPRWQMPPDDPSAAVSSHAEDISIIGRVPAEALPVIRDAEIFNQLLLRASELQEQQAQLMLINAELQEKTRRIAVTSDEPEPQDTPQPDSEDRRFQERHSELLQDQREELRRLNERLQDQADIIRRTEEFMKHQKVELTAINRLLVEQTDRQAQELHRLTQLLQDKTQALLLNQKQMDLLSRDLVSGNSNLASLQAEITNRDKSIAQQSAEITRISQLLQEREIEMRDLYRQLDTLSQLESAQAAHTAATTDKIAAFTENIKVRESEIQALLQKLSAYEAHESDLLGQKHLQSAEINHLSAELIQLTQSLQERFKIEESIQETVTRLRCELTEKDLHLETRQNQVDHLNHSLKDLEEGRLNQAQQLHDSIRDLGAELDRARLALEMKDQVIQDLEADQTRNGAAFDSVFTAHQELARRVVELQTEQEQLRADKEQTVTELLRSHVSIDGLKTEIDAMTRDRLAIEMRLRISEHNFSHQNERSAALLQSLTEAQRDMLKLNTDLAASRKAHEAWSQKWILLESDYDREKTVRIQSQESAQELHHQIHRVESQLSTERDSRAQAEALAGQLNQKLSELQLHREQISAQLAGKTLELDQLREMNSGLSRENQQVTADLVRQIGTIRAKDSELASAAQKIQDFQTQLILRSDEVKSKTLQLESLQREVTSLSQQYHATVLELAKTRDEGQRHAALSASLEQKLSAAREALRTSLDEIASNPARSSVLSGKLF